MLATRQLRYNDQKNTLSQSLVRLYADRSQLVQYQYTYGDPALGQIPDALVQMQADGRWVSFAYDRLGRLSQRSLAFAGTTKSQSYTYQTNAQGNDTTRIATYTDLLGTTHTYTYDANGNILTDSYSGLTYSYEYDSQDRLVRVNDPVQNLTQTYTYDDRGNCTRKDTYAYTTGALGTGTAQFYGYGYQAWPDALTWAGGELLSYTGGNPDNWTQNRSFAWSGGRNLQSVYQNDTLLALYNYDSAGLRVSKLTGTGSTQYYILDSQYQGQVSTINGQSYTLSYYWDEAGAPMGVKLNGSAYFFVKNLQGDVVAITDYQGNVVARYTYDVWGKVLSVVNGAGNPVTDPTHVANLNPFRYRGYFYDTETGFYYVSSRYYDPEIGRWINADSLVSTGQGILGNNMFVYCLNNPVNYIDRDGTNAEALQWWTTGMGWLPFADTALPIGDIIYVGGILLLGAFALASDQDYVPEISYDEVDVAYGPPSPNNDDDDDDYDDYYDDESNFGGRQKVGKNKGNAPGNNQAQNKQFRDATKGLTPDQQRIVHDKITGKGLGYHEIKAVIKDLFVFVFGLFAFEE